MEQIVQKIEKIQYRPLDVLSSVDCKQIARCLESMITLYDINIKSKIIENHLAYLTSKFQNPDYKIKAFIAYSGGKPCGYVVSDLNPEYKSYGRKCGTFGWLYAENFEVCKLLLTECEKFLKENKIRKNRGPVNFPKNQMGFGLQTDGFNEQILYGVACNNTNTKLGTYLANLGYISESEYTCMRVDVEKWNKGNMLAKNLKLECLPIDELTEKLDEIVDLTRDSFSTILPDTSGGGRENVMNLLKLAVNIPLAHFRHNECHDLYEKYREIPEFIEAWKDADLENMITLFPMVIERDTGKLIGMLIGVPDYYQLWRGEYVSRINVHTAMVRRGYNGKGVFSSLNNFGQATNRSMRGTTYFEGTAIWTSNSKGVNNEKAVESIFPHCTPIRKHIVYEKRVKQR